MHYIYGSARAIPTYRVYRLYDKSGKHLAKSVSYLYVRGRYTSIAFVSIIDTLGTPYNTTITTLLNYHINTSIEFCNKISGS